MRLKPRMDPNNVTSPQDKWELEEVLYTDAEQWSVAKGRWEGEPVVAIRWDGDKEDALGFPSSVGYPVWFLLPVAVGCLVEGLARVLKAVTHGNS